MGGLTFRWMPGLKESHQQNQLRRKCFHKPHFESKTETTKKGNKNKKGDTLVQEDSSIYDRETAQTEN